VHQDFHLLEPYLIFRASLSMVGIGTSARHRTLGPTRARPKWKHPMSIFDLTGRVAVITGGNGGIGLGIAQALAAAGCNVSIWGRNTYRGLFCD
jgi:phosphoglycerate dehydrogenase-like enzyme